MTASQIERRSYQVAPMALFGACSTTLGQLRATIEYQDAERGVILATVGGGLFSVGNVLLLTLHASGDTTTELSATWRAWRFGGDRRMMQIFFETLERHLAPAFT